MGIVTKFKEDINMSKVMFPYPPEVNGVSDLWENSVGWSGAKFPSPPEVNGGSYECILLCKQLPAEVSVPSRGDWGVLLIYNTIMKGV